MRKVGSALVALAIVALVITLIPADRQHSIYDPANRFLIMMLGAAGLVLFFDVRQRLASIATAVGFVAATQIAGTGAVAFRRWFIWARRSGAPVYRLHKVQALAALLAILGLIAALLCLRDLVKRSWRRVGDEEDDAHRGKGVAIAAAAVIGLTLPYFMGHGRAGAMTVTALGAHFIMYALPWAIAFGLSGWLNKPAALAIATAVPVSAIPLVYEFLMVWAFHPTTGFGMAGLAGAAVFLSRLSVGEAWRWLTKAQVA